MEIETCVFHCRIIIYFSSVLALLFLPYFSLYPCTLVKWKSPKIILHVIHTSTATLLDKKITIERVLNNMRNYVVSQNMKTHIHYPSVVTRYFTKIEYPAQVSRSSQFVNREIFHLSIIQTMCTKLNPNCR